MFVTEINTIIFSKFRKKGRTCKNVKSIKFDKFLNITCL